MKIELGTIAFVDKSEANPSKHEALTVISSIELVDHLPSESFGKISDFSRLYVVYLPSRRVNKGIGISQSSKAGNSLPLAGIPSVRKDMNPNGICIASVELIESNERSLKAKFPYAIDGALVLAMIPIPAEDVDAGKTVQSYWMGDAMKNFWRF